MLHPDTRLEFINDTIGYGVVATRFIPRGTITWVRDEFDQTFRPEQIAAMRPVYLQVLEKYGFVDARGDTVLCWDLGRFVNHSCEPTCLSPGHQFEVAVRDIHPGEELTDDYATLNLEYTFPCACGKSACRGRVTKRDCVELAEHWDRLVADAYSRMRSVEQPFWDLIAERERVEAELEGKVPIATCRDNLIAFRPQHAR
jgi:hypothetical protein